MEATAPTKVRSQVKSGTYPRKRKERDNNIRHHGHQQSPKSENSKKEPSPRQQPCIVPAVSALPGQANTATTVVAGIVLSAGNGSGSGTEKDQRSSGSGKTGPRNQRRRTQQQVPMTSSSSEDEYEKNKKTRNGRLLTQSRKSQPRDKLLSGFSTTPRPYKAPNKTSPQMVTRYKSSENILNDAKNNSIAMQQHNFSEGELLEDKSVFDFTSNRTKVSSANMTKTTTTGPFDHLLNKPNTVETNIAEDIRKPNSNNDSNSDKSHEPFGSTEFPTLKRNLKLTSSAPSPANFTVENEFKPNFTVENEYESMTSIRNSAWTPTENMSMSKTVDGLSSPSVIAQAESANHPKDTNNMAGPSEEPCIEPPPNFSSISPRLDKDKPPPLPVKKYTIRPNKHETQFHATLQRSAKNSQGGTHAHPQAVTQHAHPQQPSSSAVSPKMEAKQQGQKHSSGQPAVIVVPTSTQETPYPVSNTTQDNKVIIQPSQVRMASMQAAQEIKQRQQRSKRIRNRSLEMVLDENRSSDSSPSRKR